MSQLGGSAWSLTSAPMLTDAYAYALGSGRCSDVVAAAGLVWRSHELGMMLQRLRSARSAPLALAVLHRLESDLRTAVDKGEVRREGKKSRDIAAAALAWWLDPTCRVCGGLHWQALHARLTDAECPACSAGLRPLAGGDAGRYVAAAIERHVAASEGAHRRALG